ncbi:MAG: hypothetical protein OSA84_00920 [Akkermansiaceae bacterium]|nr:hypothetical protein [Akkermansiaceae bacterium]
MKSFLHISLITAALAVPTLQADDGEDRMEAMDRHSRGSEKLADEQDELSADVQQLVIEQTVPKVIELLTDVEGIMDETTDYLVEADTGGVTIAAQTEIIEKIHEAAKAKQKKSGSGEAGGAMMDMMERMMSKGKGEGEAEGEGKGKGAGNKGGEGQTGESDAANTSEAGTAGNKLDERTVPKAAGQAGKSLPGEFQKALDAYNRGLEDISK